MEINTAITDCTVHVIGDTMVQKLDFYLRVMNSCFMSRNSLCLAETYSKEWLRSTGMGRRGTAAEGGEGGRGGVRLTGMSTEGRRTQDNGNCARMCGTFFSTAEHFPCASLLIPYSDDDGVSGLNFRVRWEDDGRGAAELLESKPFRIHISPYYILVLLHDICAD